MFAKPGENGPLFFALLRVWLAGAGSSEFALRFQAVLAGVLAVPLTYVLVRQLMRVVYPTYPVAVHGLAMRNLALVAALLVAVNPYLTWYSQEGKMYSVLVVVILVTQLAFLAALSRADGGAGRCICSSSPGSNLRRISSPCSSRWWTSHGSCCFGRTTAVAGCLSS